MMQKIARKVVTVNVWHQRHPRFSRAIVTGLGSGYSLWLKKFAVPFLPLNPMFVPANFKKSSSSSLIALGLAQRAQHLDFNSLCWLQYRGFQTLVHKPSGADDAWRHKDDSSSKPGGPSHTYSTASAGASANINTSTYTAYCTRTRKWNRPWNGCTVIEMVCNVEINAHVQAPTEQCGTEQKQELLLPLL